jgi:4-carboxymuconolactone decarboxylase
MKIFRAAQAPPHTADSKTFAGVAHAALLASDEAAIPVGVYRVEFERGARTNWHTHTGPQWLLILNGRVRVQVWGDAAQEVEAGDAVVIHPGEKHWHGAAPGDRGAHLAVNVRATTVWLEPVTDNEYRGG